MSFFNVELVWRVRTDRPNPVTSVMFECMAAPDAKAAAKLALSLLGGNADIWKIAGVKEL